MAQKEIEIILMRQLASYLSVPIFVVDPEGTLLFYNEPAEALLGVQFDEAGEMPGEELASIFRTTNEDGSPLPSELIPINVALLERRPAYLRVRFLGLDGVWRVVEATAFPIEGQGGRHLGAMAIFWEAEPA